MTPTGDDWDRRFEHLLRDPLTRRRLMQRGAAGALGVSVLAYLAACGEETGGGAETSTEEAGVIAKGKISDSLYFANWPLYIEEDRGTLTEFEKEYGTKVKYVEEINDNVEFFGKVRQQYARGDSGGRDIHVVTDWMAARMIRLGYVQKFDKRQLPNASRNLIARLKSPPFDENRDFSMPWQSGFAGIVYRRDKVKREPRSVDDLFDPDYKGKVTMLTEMRDTVGVVAASMGFDPESASVDEFMQAIDKIGEAAESGQIRGFTGNEYTKDITKGDSWVIIGWSGDAVQLEADNPNIRFVAPESGVHLWTDNMQIPVGAPHAFTAQKMIDFVYRPEVQADIAEYVNYICPVEGVREILTRRDPALGQNQLIFPDSETLSNAFIFRQLEPDEERELDEAFQQVIGA
ncbi:MAG TPA: spermidine/putrescine ABC transporter substrate-binding protein [Thermoleophilaceae bacterium]|nr:spermidine/putrescine ABC transporter substrate-binding protein [Thermoleophilaceae bacterium]